MIKIKMSEKYKILAKFIKDMSAETPDVETFMFVKDYISKYNLKIDITSLPLKDRVIEINTKLSLSDPNNNQKKSYFEIIYATIIKVDENIKESKDKISVSSIKFRKKQYPTGFLLK